MIPSPTVSDLASTHEIKEITEFARPVVAAAERLHLIVEAAEADRVRALGELRQTLLQAGQRVIDPGQRDALARALYWRITDLPVRDIEGALGYGNHRTLMSAVGSIASGVNCDACDTPLLATSRSHLTELQKLARARPGGYQRRPLCAPCDRAQSQTQAWADSWPPDTDSGYGAWDWDPDA